MHHETFMQRCLQLAEMGRGKVAPNPMVGCVIVHNNAIIGEGFHEQYGGPHAEVNAIKSVKNSKLLQESTVYVSLEPCAHHGKTPPCADLLVKHKVKKVIVGCTDSNEKVAGKGIAILKAAGIEVETGILEKECRALNARFFTFHEQHRPYIILKWAETKDGYMAGETKQISGPVAQTLLHQWRTEESAFMVGTDTLLQDDPQLNVRYWTGNNPVRVAIDFELKSVETNKKQALHFFDGSQNTIILNRLKDERRDGISFVKIQDRSPAGIVEALFNAGIQSVVIEGGKQLLQSFLDAGLWDELRVFKSKTIQFDAGLKAPQVKAILVSETALDTDVLRIYKPAGYVVQ